jgi:hypothetical protein
MSYVRVVSFDGVSAERMAELATNVNESERPDDLPATEMILLHDPDSEQALALVFFETEDDYAKGHATLEAMPTDDTPGKRTSVTKYNVATRVTG